MAYHDGDAKDRQADDSYQSVWMAHWMRTGSNTSSRGNSCFTLHDGSEEGDCNTKHGPVLAQSKDTRKVTRLDLIVRPSNMQSFPMFCFNQNIGSEVAPTKDISVCDSYVSKTQANDKSGHVSTSCGPNFPSRLCKQASVVVEFPSKDHCSQSESITKSYLQCEKSYTSSLEKKRPFQYYLPESNSDTVSYKFKSSETPVQSFICRSKETHSICGKTSKDSFVNTKFTRLEQEPCNYFSYPTLSVSDKRIDNKLTAKDFGSSCSRRDEALEKHDSSKSNSVGETRKKRLQSFSGTGFSASRDSPPSVTKLEELNHGSQFLQKMPACSVHDVETLRICTTVDSVEGGAPGCPPKFSQMTHHLLITKKADVNLSKGKKTIGEPRLSRDFKGNALNELLMLPPNSDGVSTCTERKHAGDVETHFVDSKNDFSAETDTMDVDACDTKNLDQGMASSISNKDFVVGETSMAAQATSFLPKVRSRRTETEIPDINQEPTEVLAARRSTGKRDLSTSRTESLDEENLLPRAEKPEHLNSSPQQGMPEGQPSSRWVKHLKLTAPDSPSHARKSSRIEDGSSGKNADKLFTKIMNYNRSGSEPRLMKRLGNRQLKFDESIVLLKNWESSSLDSIKEQGDRGLSQPWIQRWCRNQAVVPWMKRAAPVVCEPEILKATPRKQFLPSIAAMALMGKATNRFRPCEFRKRGPVIVWNTEWSCEHS